MEETIIDEEIGGEGEERVEEREPKGGDQQGHQEREARQRRCSCGSWRKRGRVMQDAVVKTLVPDQWD